MWVRSEEWIRVRRRCWWAEESFRWPDLTAVSSPWVVSFGIPSTSSWCLSANCSSPSRPRTSVSTFASPRETQTRVGYLAGEGTKVLSELRQEGRYQELPNEHSPFVSEMLTSFAFSRENWARHSYSDLSCGFLVFTVLPFFAAGAAPFSRAITTQSLKRNIFLGCGFSLPTAPFTCPSRT